MTDAHRFERLLRLRESKRAGVEINLDHAAQAARRQEAEVRKRQAAYERELEQFCSGDSLDASLWLARRSVLDEQLAVTGRARALAAGLERERLRLLAALLAARLDEEKMSHLARGARAARLDRDRKEEASRLDEVAQRRRDLP